MQSETTPTLEKEDIEKLFKGFALEAQKQMTDDIYAPKHKVIILAGPTATGKSKFAIELAKEVHGEIISADAMQVYIGMDIGTAKASIEDQKLIPHHMIDVRKIDDSFSVVDFYHEATSCIESILARNAVPILVGGSGFYLHSLIYGPPSGPPAVPEIRGALMEELTKYGIETMYERLRKLDPKYAATITKKDKQKIIRGLEIIQLTGKEVSKFSWRSRKKKRSYDYRCWSLYRPKEKLFPLIEKRCDSMIKNTFLDEVRSLIEMGIEKNSTCAQAIGYRQAIEYLKSEKTDDDMRHFLETFKQASRKYAKRQFTWFRKEPLFRWLDLDMHDPEVARDMIRQDFDLSL